MSFYSNVEVELDPNTPVLTSEHDWEQYNDNCTF